MVGDAGYKRSRIVFSRWVNQGRSKLLQSNNHTKDVAMNKYRALLLGDPAPPFRQRSNGGRVFDSSAALGRYNVLCFFVTTSDAPGKAALSAIKDKRPLYGDLTFAFLGISVDLQDECKVRSGANLPAISYIWDFDGTVSLPPPVSTMCPPCGSSSSRALFMG